MRPSAPTLASILLAALPCLVLAQSQESTDAVFQKELAEKRAAMRDKREQSREQLLKDQEAAAKAAAAGYSEALKTGKLKYHDADELIVMTVNLGIEARAALVRFLYKEGRFSDSLSFVTVRGEKGDLAVWNAAGLERAGFQTSTLRSVLDSCQGADSRFFDRLLRDITAAVAETDPKLAPLNTVGIGCPSGDKEEIQGNRGPRQLDDPNTPHQGERKGDSTPPPPPPNRPPSYDPLGKEKL